MKIQCYNCKSQMIIIGYGRIRSIHMKCSDDNCTNPQKTIVRLAKKEEAQYLELKI